jgi:Na+-transporting methylmalonyl-CoA/oxaloacetate decarboxylase gamma subunit
MNTLLLADAAPTGAGLAIVGIILVALLLVFLAIVFFVARFVIRRLRGPEPEEPTSGAAPPL